MPSQRESLFSNKDQLKVEYQILKSNFEENLRDIEVLKNENSRLKEMLLELKREKFGKKSERWQSEEQGLLFNEAELEAIEPQPEDEDESEAIESAVEVKGHTKKRGKRKPLPENLPREIIEVTLPPEEQFAEDGTPLKVIGYEISEKLDYEPAKTKVIQYRRAKYGIDTGDYEKTAPPVPTIIPKGIATPGLLAAIAISKYADGLPLYRQEEIFGRNDIEISRTTMARWIVKVSEALQPIWNVLSRRLIESFYVSCDETRTQVLKEKGKVATSQSWMWVRSTPYGEGKIVLFDYKPSRSGDVPPLILEDFKGYLQVDGYAGYNKISNEEGVVRIGCNMHGRRYFEKALHVGANSGKTLAEIGLGFYQKLFEIEKEIREKPRDERFKVREEKALPIWTDFKNWVGENISKVPPKSKIGKAFSYFIGEYEYLTGYLKDGRLEIDSGFVERCIRKFAIGRNNWLFADTEAGADASALLYSIVVTAKVNQVDPYKVLRFLLEKVPTTTTLDGYENLADILVGKTPIPSVK